MPEVEIKIGGRGFEVSCQAGEEHYLHSAAKMLDDEAQVLAAQIGRLPEARMLLMAGLMLADKTAGVEDRLTEMTAQLEELQAENERLRNQPAPEPQRVEVPVMPQGVTEALAEVAARAEALAGQVDDKLRQE
ncbi:cell division protein ZapA [Thalassovita litoralis]|jgi:cell division protein ZapA|uniref:Cell division protein ZapA n=1 Tax=Thalassovita litoralis TaxID=1010611 RepID=A0A521BU78_9RHOB|nr:cell division protein ZapA [Thalassovita litoralis]SMO50708.1 cell division protein ZapA [Thalassovita litoralis]